MKMKLKNEDFNNNPAGTFVEARAIYFAMLSGDISHDKAMKKINVILLKVNKKALKIAKRYGVKFKDFTYKDLGSFI